MHKSSARKVYDKLAGNRSQFLNTAIECSELTLPYLVTEDTNSRPHKTLRQPWQNVGSSCVNVLASKLMLALLPPQTTFFQTTSTRRQAW